MIAGEPSGDAMGGDIMAALKQTQNDFHISGVGGAAMLAQGLVPVFDMGELTTLGFGQAIMAYRQLKKRADELVAHIMDSRPDAVVTIDNKGFSLRLGKMLKAAMAQQGWSAPIIHLVAPTVWAWGAWRAKSVKDSVDRLLCLFPFERPYFTCHGIDTVVVGHPAAALKRHDRQSARRQLGLAKGDKILLLLPGSRKSEISSLLPLMLDACAIIQKKHPEMKFMIVAAEATRPLLASILSQRFDNLSPIILEQSQAPLAMAAADFGLICSGTVTLEAALSGLRGHVYYKLDPLSSFIGWLVMDKTKIVLANAIAGEEIYPYALNGDCTAEKMVSHALKHFSSDSGAVPAIQSRLAHDLGDGDFATNVAMQIMAMINAR